MLFLAIDPGEKTGWAKFQDDHPIEMGETNGKEAFYRWVWGIEWNPELVVAEQYIIRPPGAGGFNHQWGKVPTIRVLGALECFCTIKNIRLEYQNSDILTPACARFGMPHPKNSRLPNRNAISAIAHGRWWWEREGKLLERA